MPVSPTENTEKGNIWISKPRFGAFVPYSCAELHLCIGALVVYLPEPPAIEHRRKLADKKPIPEYQQICAHYASTVLAGTEVLPLPEAGERTYTAEEVGGLLGVSSNKVGRLANENHLKTSEYGVQVWDKAKYSAKQVPSWRYNEKAVERLRQILSL